MGSCASVRGQVLISLEEKTNPVSHQRDPRSPISFVSNQGNWLSSPLATNSPTLKCSSFLGALMLLPIRWFFCFFFFLY